MTGYDAARHMLDANGLHDVPIEPVRGSLLTTTIQLIGSSACQNPCITKSPSRPYPLHVTK